MKWGIHGLALAQYVPLLLSLATLVVLFVVKRKDLEIPPTVLQVQGTVFYLQTHLTVEASKKTTLVEVQLD